MPFRIERSSPSGLPAADGQAYQPLHYVLRLGLAAARWNWRRAEAERPEDRDPAGTLDTVDWPSTS